MSESNVQPEKFYGKVGRNMDNGEKGRITNTALSDAMSSFYEQGNLNGHFNTIAHPPLGYGAKGCKDTEAEFYESVAFFIGGARKERSKVFLLGFGPITIPSTWIKTAELIIQGSEVQVVLVPFAKLVKRDRDRPIIRGNVIYIDKTGIFKVEAMDRMTTKEWRVLVAEKAKQLNQKLSKK